MFLDKLLNKIPFIRKRRIAKLQKELSKINSGLINGVFLDKCIISLHNIVNNPLVTFSDDFVSKSISKIELYTKSSVSALRLLMEGQKTKSQLDNSKLIYVNKKNVFFSNWYSNEDSVSDFVNLLNLYLETQVRIIKSGSNGESGFDFQEKTDEVITDHLDIELYDSLLYRLLLEDLVSIVSFYLENKYD